MGRGLAIGSTRKLLCAEGPDPFGPSRAAAGEVAASYAIDRLMASLPLAATSKALILLAAFNERLVEHASALRARPEVAGVTRGMDARTYETGAVLEMYVDAELRNGRALSWWVDVYPEDEGWSVSARVLRIRDSDQEVVLSFADTDARDLDSLEEILKSTGEQLRRSIDLVASERT